MVVHVDDVGSFPLPSWISRQVFEQAYIQAREAMINGKDLRKDSFLLDNYYNVVEDSFKKKCTAGLDVVNYPQHYDMHRQVADEILKVMEKGSFLVDERRAVLPEVQVLKEEAKEISQEIGGRIALRVCIAGPMELYLKVVGTAFYADVLLMFAETVRRFAHNSILNTKHIKTEVVSLDEPSFGFQDISADRDSLIDVLEKAFDLTGVTKQIHLHSSSKVTDLLEVRNLDVVSFEFGASPRNIESLSRKLLDEADKHVRVGIARTDIDSLLAELRDNGIEKPNAEHIIEDEGVIRKRFQAAKTKYGDRLAFVGPDCGLGGWPTQESALLLLKRTVAAVKESQA
jgi:5-methyltetrahydropteroyltriglutamate--homocysteine methyltransferase